MNKNKKPLYDAYVCYRRLYGGWEVARLINEGLKKEGINSFIDAEELESGEFMSQIIDAIEQCKYVIVVLSGNCLERCKDDTDWFRKELIKARALNKPICPVFTSDFVHTKGLPKDIEFISKMHGLLINEWNWSDVIGHIATAIDREKQKAIKSQLNSEQNNLYTLIIQKGIYYIIDFGLNKDSSESKKLLQKYKKTIMTTFNVDANKVKILSIDLDKQKIHDLSIKVDK